MLLQEPFDDIHDGVRRSRDLAPAIQVALAHREPSLLVIPIDYRENPLLTKRLGEIALAL